jgi:two-component system KDP operon response regulator KdpE
VGSTVKLELTVPEQDSSFSVLARVAYILDETTAAGANRQAGMGMEFLESESSDLLRQLEAYMTLNYGQQSEQVDSKPGNILTVGEDLDAIIENLRQHKHQVSTASTGMEALGLVLTVPFDLILAPAALPVMDGWQLLSMIRQRPTVAHIPFAFLTDGFSEEDTLRAYRQGVDDIIDRGLPDEEIALRITQTLARAQRGSQSAASKSALRGSLEDMPLTSVLSFVEVERRSGKLLVVSGADLATIYVRDGRIVDVDFPKSSKQEVLEQLFEVLDLMVGQFELINSDVDREDRVQQATGFVLMEHARRSDEAR